MARVLFEYLLPLVLPTVLYALWLVWERRRAAVSGARPPAWQEGPWFWLILSGAALTAAAFVATALVGGHAPGAKYRPPEVRDGQVVPGRFQD